MKRIEIYSRRLHQSAFSTTHRAHHGYQVTTSHLHVQVEEYGWRVQSPPGQIDSKTWLL